MCVSFSPNFALLPKFFGKRGYSVTRFFFLNKKIKKEQFWVRFIISLFLAIVDMQIIERSLFSFFLGDKS
jgi:hypothetical protein